MKKLKYLVVLLMALMIIPFGVFADETDTSEDNVSKAVTVYLFRGDGCSYCAAAEEWFNEIGLQELGKKFIVKDYETWYNQDNADLMRKVAEARNESANGVPYIIVGDQSWAGFADEYKEEIISKINSVYDQEVSERYDIMQLVETGTTKEKEKSSSSDVVALIVILAIVGAAGFAIYTTKKSVKE